MTGYLALGPGELAARAQRALAAADPCRLCPRACGARRTGGATGFCGQSAFAHVASAGAHFGEERPLVGRGGSGTIFFAGCNLGCSFCQNAAISSGAAGRPADPPALARIMLDLQAGGCHNVNLVTPTHALAGILAALALAAGAGLRLPLVYNCGGYEAPAALELLDGVVDIYMPDLKFLDPEPAGEYLQAADYPDAARAAVRAMHDQVGDLEIDENGLARRGLLVRHLVMPGHADDTRAVLEWLAAEISPATYVNVMDQYRPCHRAADHPRIGRRPTAAELRQARAEARRLGLTRGFEGPAPIEEDRC